jgi:Tfp pilus assembly protein PilN
MRRLNLASEPFRNETLPAVLLVVGLAALLVLTVQHALVIRRLLPGQTSGHHREVAALEQELARLREDARTLRGPRPDAGAVARWAALKELVDRRAFSWTGLFGVLEEVLPPGVRLESIAPKVSKGEVILDVSAVARSYDQGIELIRLLEERPEFENVYPLSRGEEQETTFRYTMRYLPPPAARAPAATTVGSSEPVSAGHQAAPATARAAAAGAPGSGS